MQHLSQDCPELFSAISELVMTVSTQRDLLVLSAAEELLEASGMHHEINELIESNALRLVCLAQATAHGNQTRDAAQKALGILNDLLVTT